VRILLPPSEAKHPGGRGRPLTGNHTGPATQRTEPAENRAGHQAELAGHRAEVLAALIRLLDRPDAAAALLLPPSVAESALATNRQAANGPTLPAVRRYAGTVYQGLAVARLSPAAQRLARTALLIFSGLLGVSRGGDPVPDYRVPAKAVLPGLGVAGTYWRPRLAGLIPALLDAGPVIDLRSSDYAAMWQPAPRGAVADRLICVRVLSPAPRGRLAVISYRSKLAKGRLAAALLERQASGRRITGPSDLLAAWAELGGADGRQRSTSRGIALDLIEPPAPYTGSG
jgi:cytoplasmic iron level regulating protein YaaA (DUF328/UPF0246 family)